MFQNSIKSAAIFYFSAILFCGSLNAYELQGVASVADGDTISIHGQKIRLHGIDAPESSQSCSANGALYRCGQKSTLALSDRIGRSPISCNGTDVDRYNRIIAICFMDGEDLNAWMVLQGWAVAYRKYSTDYVEQEEIARLSGLGIWSGEFVFPENWRRGERLGIEQTASEVGTCKIKGNINSKGDRIFHVPGGRWYDRTKINTATGERMFCSEEEAVAAGWRKSRQ